MDADYIRIRILEDNKTIDELRAALAEKDAEIERLKAQLLERTKNADFLRSMVGACHLMISRNDLGELQRQEWEPTTLPPRLLKYIKAHLAAAQQENARMRELLSRMSKYMSCQEGGDEYPTEGCGCKECVFMREVRAALSGDAAPRQAEGGRG